MIAYMLSGSRVASFEPLVRVFRLQSFKLIGSVALSSHPEFFHASIPLRKQYATFSEKAVSLFAINRLAHRYFATTDFHLTPRPTIATNPVAVMRIPLLANL
jgi:hypothetical protein